MFFKWVKMLLISKIYKYKFHNVIIKENVLIDSETEIGEYTFIGVNTKITKAKIGRYCSIAPDVSIGLGEHDLSNISTSTRFCYDNSYNILTKEQVIIKNDVWIGTKATILRGVTIGNGAVIGANAVVSKDVPDFAIVVGVPAKIIKFRFDDKISDIIAKSSWWDLPLEEAKKIQEKIKKYIERMND